MSTHKITPPQLNAAMAAIANQLYCTLSKDDFLNLGVFLSMLSKDMLSMTAFEELLKWEHRDDRCERLRQERAEREAQKEKPPEQPAPPEQPTIAER